jgi:hypothetical protein
MYSRAREAAVGPRCGGGEERGADRECAGTYIPSKAVKVDEVALVDCQSLPRTAANVGTRRRAPHDKLKSPDPIFPSQLHRCPVVREALEGLRLSASSHAGAGQPQHGSLNKAHRSRCSRRTLDRSPASYLAHLRSRHGQRRCWCRASASPRPRPHMTLATVGCPAFAGWRAARDDALRCMRGAVPGTQSTGRMNEPSIYGGVLAARPGGLEVVAAGRGSWLREATKGFSCLG